MPVDKKEKSEIAAFRVAQGQTNGRIPEICILRYVYTRYQVRHGAIT